MNSYGALQLRQAITISMQTVFVCFQSVPKSKEEEEQEHIIEIAHKCRMHITALKQKLSALLELKKSLLHDLLTGKVRVPSSVIDRLYNNAPER